MFRLVSQFWITVFVLAAGGLASAASASPVTLRYDFSAIVTSTAYSHLCYDDLPSCADYETGPGGAPTTYQGPPLSSRGAGALTVSFDPDTEYSRPEFLFSSSFPALFASFQMQSVTTYDPATRAISLWSFNYSDLFEISFNPGTGTGLAYFNYEQDGSGADWAEVKLRLFEVTVTNLTEMSPVPLPAALPLLGAAVAGLGWFGWRSSSRRA